MDRKNSMSRRQFLRLSAMAGVGVTSAAVLAACPGAAPSSGGGGGGAAAETVMLRYQSREPERAAGIAQLWDEFYPQFREDNPGVEVEFLPDPGGANRREGALSAMVAGNAPDLTEWCCSSSTFFMQKGETLDLQAFIDRDADEVNMDDYYEAQFDPWNIEGNIHLMPRFTGTQVIYFNKDMFDERGVEYPPQEWGAWDWEDYTEMLRKFADATAQPQLWGTSNYGLGANWLSQYWIRGFGANMVDPEDNTRCGLADPEAVEALEWMRGIVHDEPLFAYGADIGMGVVELFLGQRIALMEIGPWNLGVQADGATFRWDVAPMPDGPAGHTTHQSVDGTMIWKGTEYPEESWELLKWLTSPLYGRLYITWAQKQPSRKSLLPEYAQIMREANEKFEEINLDVFTDSVGQDIGGPEEMFAEDLATKNQILKPSFDRVMQLGEDPVQLIVDTADVATRFNRGEIPIEDLGAELDKLG
ncbi:substrate-binding domain-containing protein [Chloroflexi bacterium TSY]|nr:substrate-binding domain-containing protein [Chloroflexi bacterium TSY]